MRRRRTLKAMNRKLVTVEHIHAITPIEGADAIETVQVRGWRVVVKKGEFSLGDRVVYFEVDSFLPVDDERFAFLAPRGTKDVTRDDGSVVTGHVLRTAKLRGQISQGLVMALSDFSEIDQSTPEGDDVSEAIGVFKYEPPIPAELLGKIVGNFPSQYAPTTYCERVQNLSDVFDELREHQWYATLKADGTSVTIINDGQSMRYCSRNIELIPDDNLVSRKVARDLGIEAEIEPGMVVQGELVGPGIHKNRGAYQDVTLVVFAVLREGNYVPRDQWPKTIQAHAVPTLDLVFPATVDEAVAQANGLKDASGRHAEGIVWHTLNGKTLIPLNNRDCFKAINNAYLLKHGE